MKVIDSGEIILESKVIVGQPRTRTPVLHSAGVNFITYPQWTVPYSIIFKEMLPKIQKDVEYLEKEKLMVVDKYDSVIDPHTIDWSKLDKKHFPYLLRQRQGDDNSLV
jgi:murein L,D-transpeptidase YcbB/YkuD